MWTTDLFPLPGSTKKVGRACDLNGESIVVRQLDFKLVDLQFTPSDLNVVWSLICTPQLYYL